MVNEYNNTKPIDVKSSIYIKFDVKNNDNNNNLKFEVGHHVRISIYKKHFCKRLNSTFVRINFYH